MCIYMHVLFCHSTYPALFAKDFFLFWPNLGVFHRDGKNWEEQELLLKH